MAYVRTSEFREKSNFVHILKRPYFETLSILCEHTYDIHQVLK